jgi:hypothetical protein
MPSERSCGICQGVICVKRLVVGLRLFLWFVKHHAISPERIRKEHVDEK